MKRNILSELLKSARVQAGLTQVQLAKMANTDQPSIARAEHGNVSNLKWVEKLIRVCGYELKFHHISLVKNNTQYTMFFGA